MKLALRFLFFSCLVLVASAIDPRKRVLISDILEVTDARGNLERLRLENVDWVRKTFEPKPGEAPPDAYARRVLDRALEKYVEQSKETFSWSRREDTYVAQYDQFFTEAQLKALLAFLKTDAGQAMLRSQANMASGLQRQLADARNSESNRPDIMKEAIAEVEAEIRTENEKLFSMSIPEVEERARNGNSVAQYLMGSYYADGQGVAKNATEAAKWFRMGAARKHPGCQGRLAWLYWQGEGVDKDLKQAVALFTEAANAGDTMSTYCLGVLYRQGEGVEKDAKQAFPLLLKAAQAGHGGAQYELAVIYWNGEGVEKKPSEAYAWALVARDSDVKLAEDFIEFANSLLSRDDSADGMMRSAELRRAIKAQR